MRKRSQQTGQAAESVMLNNFFPALTQPNGDNEGMSPEDYAAMQAMQIQH